MARTSSQTFAEYRSNHRPGVWSQIGTILLHPVAFFKALPPLGQTRQWVWVALIILALVGFSAVRQQSGPAEGLEVPAPDLSGEMGGMGGAMSGRFPAQDAPPSVPLTNVAGNGNNGVASTWTAALTAAAGIVVQWLLAAVLLLEAPLLSGQRPRYSAGLHVAIWASVPLGIMAALQIVYLLAGGELGAPGISGVIPALPGYAALPDLARHILDALAGQLTLFWVWTLILLGLGARHALGTRGWAAAFSVALWAVLVVLVPVISRALGG